MKSIFLAGFILFIISCSGRREIFVSSGDTAIRGYDPVAYFLKEKPVMGSAEFQYSWHGAVWVFSTRENRDLFMASPEKYAPQYGGYCAFGLSNGYKAPTDPAAWTIVNGKLYLNYNSDVRDEWFKEKEVRIRKGDLNWPGVKDENFN